MARLTRSRAVTPGHGAPDEPWVHHGAPDEPWVHLLDARADDLDEPGLRRLARAQSADAAYASRSYGYPFALVARHTEPVGVDLERVTSCDASFIESICTPAERVELAGVADPDALFTGLWSAKEALAKALGDAVAYDPRWLESPLRWPNGRAGRWRARRLAAPEGHVAWLCWRAS